MENLILGLAKVLENRPELFRGDMADELVNIDELYMNWAVASSDCFDGHVYALDNLLLVFLKGVKAGF